MADNGGNRSVPAESSDRIRISVLDLAPIVQGSDASTALSNTIPLAQAAERLGFVRYWVAEHHNMQGIASSATAVVIGHVAAATEHIRVGSGGIMLPNHAPLVIAEQFGTLASIYPGRIDLGLGRAPGTDQQTAYALRRTLNSAVDSFPQDIRELQFFLGPRQENQKVHAIPGVNTNVPIWILGSSLYGAQVAAMYGLPFGFASHFAPAMMHEAIAIYREKFRPSDQLDRPYVMLGYNVCAADSEEEAQYLRTSGLQSFLRMRTGQPSRLPPPVKDFEANLDPTSRNMLKTARAASVVGDRQAVLAGMQEFVDDTQADELIVVCQIYDFHKRLRSYEIVADVAREIRRNFAMEAT
ncbi:MAG: LLM class flavin-dependent oxidoreductase [Gammaproteobacteria bacterium]|nr:LLM class flavin-dependent oxidoreductase [Gammaproteobacteria bacterium]